MKKGILFLTLMIFALCAFGQNLILNGGFESGPPVTGLSQLHHATGWSHQYPYYNSLNNPNYKSTDLYEVGGPCAVSNHEMGIPSNYYTSNLPAIHGSRYAGGGGVWMSPSGSFWTNFETCVGSLVNTLEACETYEVAFAHAPGDGNIYNCSTTPSSTFPASRSLSTMKMRVTLRNSNNPSVGLILDNVPLVPQVNTWGMYSFTFELTKSQAATSWDKIEFLLTNTGANDRIFYLDSTSLTKVEPCFELLKDTICLGESISPDFNCLNYNLTSYRWRVDEKDPNTGLWITKYVTSYMNAPIANVDISNYWNGYAERGSYRIWLETKRDCEGDVINKSIYRDIYIAPKPGPFIGLAYNLPCDEGCIDIGLDLNSVIPPFASPEGYPFTALWNDNSTSFIRNVCLSQTTTYPVTYTNRWGCQTSHSYTVNKNINDYEEIIEYINLPCESIVNLDDFIPDNPEYNGLPISWTDVLGNSISNSLTALKSQTVIGYLYPSYCLTVKVVLEIEVNCCIKDIDFNSFNKTYIVAPNNVSSFKSSKLVNDGGSIILSLAGPAYNLTRTDKTGAIKWSKTYYPENGRYFPEEVLYINGTYIVVGTHSGQGIIYNNSKDQTYGFIARYSSSGSLMWHKIINSPLQRSGNIHDLSNKFNAACISHDANNNIDGFVVAGMLKRDLNGPLRTVRVLTSNGSYYNSQVSSSLDDMIAIKFNLNGNEMWYNELYLDGNIGDPFAHPYNLETATQIIETKDFAGNVSGYALAGKLEYFASSQLIGRTNFGAFIVTLNGQGAIQNNRIIEDKDLDPRDLLLTQKDDNSDVALLLTAVQSSNTQIEKTVLFKFDMNLNQQWQRKLTCTSSPSGLASNALNAWDVAEIKNSSNTTGYLFGGINDKNGILFETNISGIPLSGPTNINMEFLIGNSSSTVRKDHTTSNLINKTIEGGYQYCIPYDYNSPNLPAGQIVKTDDLGETTCRNSGVIIDVLNEVPIPILSFLPHEENQGDYNEFQPMLNPNDVQSSAKCCNNNFTYYDDLWAEYDPCDDLIIDLELQYLDGNLLAVVPSLLGFDFGEVQIVESYLDLDGLGYISGMSLLPPFMLDPNSIAPGHYTFCYFVRLSNGCIKEVCINWDHMIATGGDDDNTGGITNDAPQNEERKKENHEEYANYQIIPNPTKGKVKVFYQGDISKEAYLNLYNSQGSLLQTNRLDKLIELDLSQYSKGIYFIEVFNGKETLKPQKIILN